MRLRRSLCCVIATISCSLSAAPAANAAQGPTVAAELTRLAAEGAMTPEDAAARRAVYDDAKSKVKSLTGARKVELGGVVKDLEGMAARDQFRVPSRIPALFLTLQRNVEYWSTQPLLKAGARTASRAPSSSSSSTRGTGCRSSGSGPSASSTATGAAASATTPAPARC